MPYTGSKAKAGRGTILSIGAITGATAAAFVPVGELDDSSFSGGAWSFEETTNFDSGVDEEFLVTTRNNGELSLSGNLIDGDTGQNAVNAAYDSGDKHDFQVQLRPGPGQTTGTLYKFSALVMSFFDISIKTKSRISFTGKLKISGPITKVVGS
jgi:hypothetical protein